MMAVAGAGGADVPMAIVVDGVEQPIRMIGASFTFTSGAAAGRRLYCIGAVGDALMSSAISGPIYDGVSDGDELVIDNRDWLAFCYYHRHQVRDGNHASRQFVVDGKPVYPQRPPFPMAELRSTTRAGDHSGRFVGKMIVVQNTCDDYAWPHAGHMYGLLVRDALGDSFDDQFRLWYNDHAAHLPAAPTSTRLVNYRGSVEQALRDVVEWVEHGTAPPATTGYRWHDESSALTLAATAAERRGIQPVVTLRVEGGERADARVGEHRHLRSDRGSSTGYRHAHPRRVGLRRRGRLAGRRRLRRRFAGERDADRAPHVRRARRLLSVSTRDRAPRR